MRNISLNPTLYQATGSEHSLPKVTRWKPLDTAYATVATAISVFISAYSGFMVMGYLVFFLAWLPLVFLKGIAIALPPKGSALLVTYLALCWLSILWSDYPGTTLHAAIELSSMVAISFIMARLVPIESYIKGLIIGLAAALLLSVIDGTYGQDPFTGAFTLIGRFGSKNQIGFCAELLIYLSLIFLFCPVPRLNKLLLVPGSLLLGLYCLWYGHSATSDASLAATFLVIAGIYLLLRLPRRMRRLAFIGAIGFAIVVLAAGAGLGWQDIVLHLLGKDSTLTGRTLLWAEGYEVGMRSPFTGVGYTAFWVAGRPKAEELWYMFGVYNRVGFYFHNTYIEAFVSFGVFGVTLFATWLLTSVTKSITAAITYGLVPEVAMAAGISTMLFVRSFAEMETFGPYGLGVLIFYPLLPRLAMMNAAKGKRAGHEP